MKFIRNIGIYLLVTFFIMSTGGILVYQAFCACSGNEYVSVYVKPDSCGEHHQENPLHCSNENENSQPVSNCNECSVQTNECECKEPEVRYFKLENQIFPGTIRVKKPEPVQIQLFEIPDNFSQIKLPQNAHGRFYEVSILPLVKTPLEYLIFIRQLKIPSLV